MSIPIAKLPPFSDVIKSRDVEDPVNLWVHRPLAYGLVGLTLRTPLTPNQITVLSLCCGLTTAVLWFLGQPAMIPLGGALLWASAILDGADGIMARAKHMHSDLGRALDGSADMIVAIFTVAAGFWHIWVNYGSLLHVQLMPVALISAVFQIWLYDFYKECYLNSTRPGWDGRTFSRADAADRLAGARDQGASAVARFAWSMLLGMLHHQHRLLRITNSGAIREGLKFPVNDNSIAIYRKHNYWPMQLWTLVSLCPHTYLMSIAAIMGRLDLYLWFRVIPGNVIWVVVLVWQRVATRRTLRELEREGLAPTPAAAGEAGQAAG